MEHNNTLKVELLKVNSTQRAKYKCKLCTTVNSKLPGTERSLGFIPEGKFQISVWEGDESFTAQRKDMANIQEYFSGDSKEKLRALIL